MANEITIQYALSQRNGNARYSNSESFNADQANAEGPSPGFQTIGTTYEAITPVDLTNKGVAEFKNLDDTNFVEIGVEVASTFYPFLRLLPGESYPVRLSPSIGLFAKADTAAVDIQANVFGA